MLIHAHLIYSSVTLVHALVRDRLLELFQVLRLGLDERIELRLLLLLLLVVARVIAGEGIHHFRENALDRRRLGLIRALVRRPTNAEK